MEPASPPGEAVYEPPPPPPPFYEPPPPAPPDLRAPKTALWLGVRPSLFVPFGSLWIDGFQSPSGVYYRRRTFANYAAPGPGAEFDAGARFSRRYMVFALYQHAELGTGNLDDAAFGGQERGATNFYGVGLRFSTDPAAIGFALEIALGYRDFTAYWSDGTKLSMTDGILDARIGLGADFRLSRHFTLDPMLVLGGGSFGSRKWSGSITEGSGFASTDEAGEYGTLELQLGAHFDVY
ncbi:MAG TPA: hypothetical protein VHE30_03610 [Polyangiaceae bacterium]|nr:hypothetical protein [Polyangiaceae bacterium]